MSNPTHRRLLDFFSKFKKGDQINQKELMTAMNWSEKSLKTYISKRKLEPFVRKSSNGLVAIQNGDGIKLKDITNAFKQVNDPIFVVYEGLSIQGNVGSYTIAGELGRGAIGHVWKATQEYMGSKRDVAIKFLQPRAEFFEESKLNNIERRFTYESMHGQQLQHDRIIRYIDSGTHAKVPFMAMELGIRSAEQLLAISEALSVRKTIEIVSACVEGLQYIHSQDLIHRDVKPANILQTERGFVLGDLGIMQWSDFGAAFTNAGTLTRASIQLGSWYYMAPEQSDDPHNVTSAVDVYALGITWYELLTNKQPNPRAVSAGRLTPATDIKRLNDLIKSMTSYDAVERPTADIVAKKIAEIRANLV